MRFSVLLLLTNFVFLPSMATWASATGPELRGYAEIDQVLSERLFVPGYSLTLAGLGSDQLALLLGGYENNPSVDGAFLNATPSGTNFLLLSMIAEHFGIIAATSCNGAGSDASKDFRPEVLTLLLSFCNWPVLPPNYATPDLLLYDLWLSLISFDAPIEEFEAWKTFVLKQYGSGSGAPGAKALLKGAVPAAFLNPYFLLRP